jgi:hypothetical protein
LYLKASIRFLQTMWISLHRKLRILNSDKSQEDLKLGLGRSPSCIIRLSITYIFEFSLVSEIASVHNDTASAVEVELREVTVVSFCSQWVEIMLEGYLDLLAMKNPSLSCSCTKSLKSKPITHHQHEGNKDGTIHFHTHYLVHIMLYTSRKGCK